MEKSNGNKSVRAIPEGFHSVTPFLMVNDAVGFIEFLKKAFNAKLTYLLKEDNGKVMHSTVTIGNSIVMICDAMDGMEPQPGTLYLYLDDADAAYKQALQANATVVHEPTTEFYGDRAGAVKDPWGNVWWVATHVEDVDDKELERRSKIVMKERREKGQEVHA
jgi:PhnB protein